MSPAPEGRGSLKFAIDRLEELETQIHPTLAVYRWWRSDMKLPAVWNWLTPGDVESAGTQGANGCRISDLLRITVSIGIDPSAIAGMGDMLELEEYFELALDVLDAELYGRNPLGQRRASRRGAQTVADRLGDASILVLECPLEVYLDRTVIPNP
jgi:hypothetical protein